MAIREYKCTSCGAVHDILISGDPPKVSSCPLCSEKAALIFSVSSFKLSFRDGWDAGAGKHFSSQRERDTYLDRHELVKNPDGAFGTEGG